MADPSPLTLDKLRILVGQACDVEPSTIQAAARLRGYGVDSIRVIDIMLSIEDVFNVQFELEDLEPIRTIGELAEYIDRLRSKTIPASRGNA